MGILLIPHQQTRYLLAQKCTQNTKNWHHASNRREDIKQKSQKNILQCPTSREHNSNQTNVLPWENCQRPKRPPTKANDNRMECKPTPARRSTHHQQESARVITPHPNPQRNDRNNHIKKQNSWQTHNKRHSAQRWENGAMDQIAEAEGLWNW